MSQPSIFGRSIGGGKRIDLDISGGDLEQVLGVALRAMGLIGETLPRKDGHQIETEPRIELGALVRAADRIRLADAGVSA